MEEQILLMDNITVIYPNGFAANKHVRLECSRGSIHALLGENGAGKTTLMKVLFGFITPTEGQIYIKGKAIRFRDSLDAIQHGVGMVLDWGVHLLDQILMLTEGKKLLTVYATLTNITNYEVDDGVRAIMKFEDALEVLVEVYTNNFIGAPRWYMAGENGTAIIENWDLKGKIIKIRNWEKIDAVPIKAGTGLTKTMAPRTNDTIRRYPIKKVRVNWENYYDNIYDVIRNSAQQLITHDQLRRSMKLMEAIFESARRNEVIELNI